MPCQYLLDTNICIYIAKRRPIEVANRFAERQPGDVAMSIITFGELLYGAEKSQNYQAVMDRLDAFVNLVPVLTLPPESSALYARIRAHLERSGRPIGANDLWIAAHALSSNLILVSNNLKEFDRVPGLRTENWAQQ